MRRGILSDEAIKRMYPEHFPLDFRTHQLIYEDGVDIPKHKLTGIKRSTRFGDGGGQGGAH